MLGTCRPSVSLLAVLCALPAIADAQGGYFVSLRFFEDPQSIYPVDGGGLTTIDPELLVTVQGDLIQPGGIAVDGAYVYVAEGTGGIVRVDSQAQSQAVFAVDASLQQVSDVALDLDGDLLAVSWNGDLASSGVFEIDRDTQDVFPISTGAPTGGARTIAVDANGTIYVTSIRDVLKVERDGSSEVVATLADIMTAIAWHPVLEQLIVGTWRGELWSVDPETGHTVLLIDQDPLNQVRGITVSAEGEIAFNNFYVKEDIDGTIIRITTNAQRPGESPRELMEFFGADAFGIAAVPEPLGAARSVAALLALIAVRRRSFGRHLRQR